MPPASRRRWPFASRSCRGTICAPLEGVQATAAVVVIDRMWIGLLACSRTCSLVPLCGGDGSLHVVAPFGGSRPRQRSRICSRRDRESARAARQQNHRVPRASGGGDCDGSDGGGKGAVPLAERCSSHCKHSKTMSLKVKLCHDCMSTKVRHVGKFA